MIINLFQKTEKGVTNMERVASINYGYCDAKTRTLICRNISLSLSLSLTH